MLWALSLRSLDVPTAPAAQHLALVLDHMDTPDLTLEDTTREEGETNVGNEKTSAIVAGILKRRRRCRDNCTTEQQEAQSSE